MRLISAVFAKNTSIRAAIQVSISRTNVYSNKSRISNISLPIFNKPVAQRTSPFLSKRFFCATRDEKYLETVPFTNRTRYVISSPEHKNNIGEESGEELKNKYKGKVLPSRHPGHIRAQRLARDIIMAFDTALKEYEGNNDDTRRRLEGLHWKVLVVDDPKDDAYCVAAGSIVIYTGLLEKMSSDAEVAFVIAQGVAYAVAGHAMEISSKFGWWWYNISMILEAFLPVDHVSKIGTFLLLPLSMRFVIEADSIAVLVMAFAGYDPQVGPETIKKYLHGILRYVRIISLGRTKLMHDAMKIYMAKVGKSSM